MPFMQVFRKGIKTMKHLLFAILLLASFGCKKESFVTYRIDSVQRPINSFACKYTATANGKPVMVFTEECGKYKEGDTFKVEF